MKLKFLVSILLLLSFPFTLFGLTIEEEKKYGKEVFLEIAKSMPINNDPYISVYVQTIKDSLESNAASPLPITLTIIDSQSADAFATIGGYVFITMGLIALCDKEEELAGVLAHEFAHVSRRHIAKRVDKEKYINAASIASLLAAILVPDAKAKNAILTMGMGSAQALSLKYSREDEEEADKVGSFMADSSGYGGLGTADFLRKLKAGGGDKVLPQYLLTHPYHEERIMKLESMWQRKKIDIDTAFFPYLVARAKILHKDARGGSEDIWINKYAKDKTDPVNIYAASLIYAAKGDADKSVDIIIEMKSPYKNMFFGEMLVDAHRFKEAAVILKDETYPVSRYYLAKAYEGTGDRDMAINMLGQILRYGNAYPEIYYRYGMLLGRKGQEARGHEYLGRFYLETGRLDIARNHFEKAISKYGINSREAADLLKILDGMKGGAPRPNK
jgi:beta-barrel assembly-enhancing protease